MITLPAIRSRVETRINQRDSRRATASILDIDEAICLCYLEIRADLPAARLYSGSAFTLVNADGTFTLPGAGAQYAGEVRMQLVSNSQFLTFRTVEELDNFRRGQTAPITGKPNQFCLWLDKAQVVQGRCWPGPLVPEPINLFASLDAEDLRDTDLDTVQINLSRLGETALVYKTSALIASGMASDDLKERRLNPNVAGIWTKSANKLVYKAACEAADIETTGRTQRWQV